MKVGGNDKKMELDVILQCEIYFSTKTMKSFRGHGGHIGIGGLRKVSKFPN